MNKKQQNIIIEALNEQGYYTKKQKELLVDIIDYTAKVLKKHKLPVSVEKIANAYLYTTQVQLNRNIFVGVDCEECFEKIDALTKGQYFEDMEIFDFMEAVYVASGRCTLARMQNSGSNVTKEDVKQAKQYVVI